MPVRAGKDPLFEDAPNFDTAFRLFHGRDGVVPLSERSRSFAEKKPQATLPAFNPLAVKAATISLSSFGPGDPFGFDSFSKKWNNEKESGKSSQKRSSSKVLQPHPGIKLKCPPAVVAARAAIARTAFAKNLQPQPLPAKVFVIRMLGMAANVPLGIWREHTENFSPSWFTAVHAAVPFIAILRKSVLMPKSAMAFTIAALVLGQVIGLQCTALPAEGNSYKRPDEHGSRKRRNASR